MRKNILADNRWMHVDLLDFAIDTFISELREAFLAFVLTRTDYQYLDCAFIYLKMYL
jgi:hypothetical protein